MPAASDGRSPKSAARISPASKVDGGLVVAGQGRHASLSGQDGHGVRVRLDHVIEEGEGGVIVTEVDVGVGDRRLHTEVVGPGLVHRVEDLERSSELVLG